MTVKKEKTISREIFEDISTAVAKTKKEKGYSTIHSVFSGLIDYECEKHNLERAEIVQILKALEEEGKIYQRPAKRGFLVGLGAAPEKTSNGNSFKKLLS